MTAITLRVALRHSYDTTESLEVTVEVPEDFGREAFTALHEEVLRLEGTVRRNVKALREAAEDEE